MRCRSRQGALIWVKATRYGRKVDRVRKQPAMAHIPRRHIFLRRFSSVGAGIVGNRRRRPRAQAPRRQAPSRSGGDPFCRVFRRFADRHPCRAIERSPVAGRPDGHHARFRRPFVAVAVALFLQAMLFGVGGLTTLGVNASSISLCRACVLAVRLRAGDPLQDGFAGQRVRRCRLSVGGGCPCSAPVHWLRLSLFAVLASAYTPVASVLLATYHAARRRRGLHHGCDGRELSRPRLPRCADALVPVTP